MADIDTRTSGVEQLIDTFIVEAQIAEGLPAAWLDLHGQHVRGVAGRPVKERKRQPPWISEEEAFVIQNRGIMSIEEIGERLGRSANAIKVRGYRIQATTPRYASGYISGNQIAHILGVDSHAPPAWIDNGFLEGELFPYQGRVNRRVHWPVFLRWLIRPTSWVYFKVARIKNDHVRRLVELAQERWGDQWLSTRQAADLRGCELDHIQQAILHGRLHGYHAGSLDRKRQWGWAHWFVLQSEVERLQLPWGCREGRAIQWSPRADAFIIRARRERIAYEDMAKMMKWPQKRIVYRVMLLRKQGLIETIKPRGKVKDHVSRRVCVVCGLHPSAGRSWTCSEECHKEYHRRFARKLYQKMHPNYKTGIRAPRVKKAKPPKPEKPFGYCEICGHLLTSRKAMICRSPECRAERIRRYGRKANELLKKCGLREMETVSTETEVVH